MDKAIIEIPKGSKYKYELKKEGLILDRVLNQECPYNYGFLPGTTAGDGDTQDVFVISRYPINPLTEVSIIFVGMYRCLDDGEEDNKYIALLKGEEHYFEELNEVKQNIENYLTTYKSNFIILDKF